MVGLAIDNKAALLSKLRKRAGVSYPVLLANSKTWNAYHVNTLPSLVLIDRDGRILKSYGGESDKKAMADAIERALKEVAR